MSTLLNSRTHRLLVPHTICFQPWYSPERTKGIWSTIVTTPRLLSRENEVMWMERKNVHKKNDTTVRSNETGHSVSFALAAFLGGNHTSEALSCLCIYSNTLK